MALAWRPSGSLIASTQVLPNKYQVVFFEKNGLRHGEFTLPFAPGDGVVRQLSWNAQSDVLCVWYEEGDIDHLLLCAVGNYHWYVKQRFCFPTKRRLLACTWDPEKSLRLHVLHGLGRYAVYDWIWTVNRSSPYAEKNRGEVAVIDGQEVLFTAFAEKVVPPPMCALRVQLPANVNQLVWGPPSLPQSVCTVLSNGRLALFDGPERALRWVRCVHVALEDVQALHHWLWLSQLTLMCAATVGKASRLLLLHIKEQATEENEDTLQTEVLEVYVDEPVLSLSLVGDGKQGLVVVQTASGEFFLLNVEQARETASSALQPMATCHKKLVQVHALPCPHRTLPCLVGLSGCGRLFIDSLSQEVASNVTSVLLLPPACLLLTTAAHALLCLHLDLSKQDGPVCATLSEAVSRRVERGSRLVSAGGARVVLQMPRGNLETITPRPLVLEEAAHDLDEGRFAEVFELFRKQRINLNLLVDHKPVLFLKCAEDFVRYIKNRSWLSLLAVELAEEDVTKTTYANSYCAIARSEEPPWEEGCKRVTVCARLCQAMEVVGAESSDAEASFFLPRLSLLAVGLGDLAAALSALQTAATRGLPRDDGLRHLLTLCDAKALFRAALGLYDFQMAATVAAHSNRDPKEYLPFLNELRRLDESYRCYRVDAYLNRWESALTHLAHCPEREEEFLNVMQERGLYSYALTLFSSRNVRYRNVATKYGEYLLKERKLEEAAVMLRRAGLRVQALEACRMAGDWQQALVLLSEMQFTPETRLEHLRSLCAVLLQQRRFQEAAHVFFRQCACAEEAVTALCQGRHWSEAQQLAIEAQCTDVMEFTVEVGIVEHWELLQAEVNGHKTTYQSHLKRLRLLRTEKSSLPQGRAEEVAAESDLFSDTSSTSGSASFQSGHSGSHSRRSSRSGKNRRKQERKLLSLKEGAPYEDLALLRAMHQIATTCFALRKEVRALCLALLSVGHDADAGRLQDGLASALLLIEESRAEVWPPELCSPNALTAAEERYGPEATVNSIVSGTTKAKVLVQNVELLEPQFRIPPQVQDHLNWKLSILNT